MNFDKKKLIDFTFSKLLYSGASFADCGGAWNVDGLYTFYTLDTYSISRAFVIDTNSTEMSIKMAQRYNNLTVINKNFGDAEVLDQIGKVDAILFFDVLLHQVKPDWNEILSMYSQIAKCFVIYNPQYVASNKSVRLLDMGETEYFKNVPHPKEHHLYCDLFDKMYKINPEHNRIWRDIHNVWQWGITDADLCGQMDDLGFSLKFSNNYGHFGRLDNFENHGFVFQKIDKHYYKD